MKFKINSSYIQNLRRKYFSGSFVHTFGSAILSLLASGVTITAAILTVYGIWCILVWLGVQIDDCNSFFCFEKDEGASISDVAALLIATAGLGFAYYKACSKIIVKRDSTVFKEKFRIYHEYHQFITKVINQGKITQQDKSEVQRLLANITTIFNAENSKDLKNIIKDTVQILADIGDVQLKNKNRQGIGQNDYFDRRNHLERLLNIADAFRRDLHNIPPGEREDGKQRDEGELFAHIQTAELPIGQMAATPLAGYHLQRDFITQDNIAARLSNLPDTFHEKFKSYTEHKEEVIISMQTKNFYLKQPNPYRVEVSLVYSHRLGQYYFRWKLLNKHPEHLLKESVQHSLSTLMCELRGSGNVSNEWTLNAAESIEDLFTATDPNKVCDEIAGRLRSICNLTDAMMIQYYLRAKIEESPFDMKPYWKPFLWDYSTVAYNSKSKPKEKTEYIDITQSWPKRECRIVVGCRYHGDLPSLKLRMENQKHFSYVAGSRLYYSDRAYRIGPEIHDIIIELITITLALNGETSTSTDTK